MHPYLPPAVAARYTAPVPPPVHTIRPDKERETAQRLQAAYGKKFDSGMLAQSRKDVAKMLDEPEESVSIHQKLQQLQAQQTKQRHKKEHGQDR